MATWLKLCKETDSNGGHYTQRHAEHFMCNTVKSTADKIKRSNNLVGLTVLENVIEYEVKSETVKKPNGRFRTWRGSIPFRSEKESKSGLTVDNDVNFDVIKADSYCECPAGKLCYHALAVLWYIATAGNTVCPAARAGNLPETQWVWYVGNIPGYDGTQCIVSDYGKKIKEYRVASIEDVQADNNDALIFYDSWVKSCRLYCGEVKHLVGKFVAHRLDHDNRRRTSMGLEMLHEEVEAPLELAFPSKDIDVIIPDEVAMQSVPAAAFDSMEVEFASTAEVEGIVVPSELTPSANLKLGMEFPEVLDPSMRAKLNFASQFF